MTLTLSKIMQRTWREIGHLKDITATGGSTTTVVDTNSPYTDDDVLIGGTVIVVRDADGAGAAPEGEFGRISDYDAAPTPTFTMATLSAAVAAGDSIGLARPTIPATQMVQAVNDALTDLGPLDLVDATISTSADTYEYTLPVALKMDDLVDVKVVPSDGRPYSVKGMVQVEPAAPGTAGKLLINEDLGSVTLRIFYKGYHPRLTVFSSTISETIPEPLIVAASIDKALTWLVSKRGESALGTFLLARWNDAKQTIMNTKVTAPAFKMQTQTRWFSFGSHDGFK